MAQRSNSSSLTKNRIDRKTRALISAWFCNVRYAVVQRGS